MANTFDSNSIDKVPNSTAVLVLGLLSLVGCCITGFGPILAVVGLIMASKGSRAYAANPDAFMPSSYSQLKAGKIMCWISFILGLLLLLVLGAAYAIFGTESMNQIWECRELGDMDEINECMQEIVEELMGQ